MRIDWDKRPPRHRCTKRELLELMCSTKTVETITSTYRGVRGTKQQDGSILWRPYVKRPSGWRPLGVITYTSEQQAAIAYDEHMIKECGYDAVLNFHAEAHKERKRAERRARREAVAQLSHLRQLQEQGHITEREMESRIWGSSNLNVDNLSISNPPAKAADTKIESSDDDEEEDAVAVMLHAYMYSR